MQMADLRMGGGREGDRQAGTGKGHRYIYSEVETLGNSLGMVYSWQSI